jgi:hypothetical protein
MKRVQKEKGNFKPWRKKDCWLSFMETTFNHLHQLRNILTRCSKSIEPIYRKFLFSYLITKNV